MADVLQAVSKRRAWIAVGLAVASYVATNVVKAYIDKELGRYSAIVERAKSLEAEGIVRLSSDAQQTLISQLILLQAIGNQISERGLLEDKRKDTPTFFISSGMMNEMNQQFASSLLKNSF